MGPAWGGCLTQRKNGLWVRDARIKDAGGNTTVISASSMDLSECERKFEAKLEAFMENNDIHSTPGRRRNGDGTVYFDSVKRRYIGEVEIVHKRRRVSSLTEDGAWSKLREIGVTDNTHLPEVVIGSHDDRRKGYVYVVHDTASGLYKIGMTVSSVADRVQTIRAHVPTCSLFTSFPCDDALASERRVHHYFSTYRKHGEWFALTDDDARLLKGVKRMTVHRCEEQVA